MTVGNDTWRGKKESIAVEISGDVHSEIKRYCMQKYPVETGGILIGKYSKDLNTAMITFVTGPPPDSLFGRTWFGRGVQGLKQLLLNFWRDKKGYYLGEWHFHPDGSSSASDKDRREIQRIANSKDYHCPEPLLLIAGGHPRKNLDIGIYVHKSGKLITLEGKGPQINVLR